MWLVGALDVQAGPVRFRQHPGGEHIDAHPDDRHHQHGAALHGRRVEQAPDGLERHQRADHQQGDAVTGRRQDFRALPAEGPLPGRGAGGQADGPQRRPEGPDVGAVALLPNSGPAQGH